MIQLAAECLLMQNPDGDLIPCSAEMVSVELVGAAGLIDPEIVNNAALSVLHYFKVELCRDTVTLGEFSQALEKVLQKFGVEVRSQVKGPKQKKAPAADQPARPATSLATLAHEAGQAGELVFFPRLRESVRLQLEAAPPVLAFCDLRPCVKTLTGARRWSARCQELHDQIVEFLRSSLSSDLQGRPCGLVVR